MIATVLFTVGWAISVGLLVAVFLTYRDFKKVLGNANKSAFYDDLDARISRLQREIEEKMPEVDRLRAEKQSAELDAEAAKRQKLEEERQLDTTRAEILRLRDQIQQLQPELEELRKTREALDRTRLELSDGQKTLADQMGKLGSAQAEMAAALVRRDEAQSDLRKFEERLPGLRAETASLEVKERQLRESCAEIQAEAGQAGARLEEARLRQRETEDACRQLDGLVAQMTARREALSEEIRTSEQSLAEMKQQVAALERSLRELAAAEENARRNLQRTSEELGDLSSRRDAAANDLARLAAAAEEARGRVADLERTRDRLQNDAQILESRLRSLDEERNSRERQLADLQNRTSEMDRRLSEATSAEDSARRNLRRLGDELAALETEKSSVESLLKKLTEEAEALKSLKAALTNEESALRGKIEAEKAQLEGLEASRGALKQVVDSLTEAASQYGVHAKVSASDALEDIKQPVQFGFAGKTRGPVPTEEQLLKDLPGRLSSAGLSFHPRVLAAFHTSLKTSDYNQLTVLAGVSGTGKSALPRAYAAAMGIHSLVVPVQPGWAGPQDLLGFFNYLERKYKATELSRYIAHFSQYAKQDLGGVEFKEAGDRSGELLLVLLDEMNLARVEYYFSEFLSRLEMRSSIDPKNEEQRRKVAIPLDTGPLKETTRRLVLYPDTNILFVGTMNEDESTQTLSEKVVDRANVLRFGSPHLSSFGQSRRTSSAVASTESALGRGEWEKWCSPKRAGMSVAARLKGFEDALPRLSQVMDDLGRPFGHRVYEAIRLYILAYPSFQANEEEKAGRIALADQMEQKVLPKLRGVDTSERAKDLSTLKKLIAELDDPLLSASFAKAQDRPTFEWQGVKRDESGG